MFHVKQTKFDAFAVYLKVCYMDSNKRRILLINPPVYDFAAFDLWAKPLGILYLSSILKQNGFEVELLDYMDRHFGSVESKSDKNGCGHYNKQRVENPQALINVPRYFSRYGIAKDTAEKFLKETAFTLHSQKNYSGTNLPSEIYVPDIILVTSIMTYWYPGVWETIETVKKIFPKVPVVLGGAYATLCSDHAQKSGADHIVKGGFASLNKVLSSLGVHVSIPAAFSAFPSPDFSYYSKNKYAVLRMSMGCPFRCSYCAQDILCDNKYEIKDWQDVFAEVKAFADSGIKHIAFYDDALLYKADENIKPLLRQIIKENLNINIHTPNGLHARYLDLELAKLMKEAGFIMPRFSLETSDAASQKETGAKVSNDIYISAMRMLQEAGYKKGEYLTYLLMGMPGQSLEEVRKSVIFVNELGSKVSLSEYSVIPGTKDFANVDSKFSQEPLYHNKSVFPMFSLNEWEYVRDVKALAIKMNSLL